MFSANSNSELKTEPTSLLTKHTILNQKDKKNVFNIHQIEIIVSIKRKLSVQSVLLTYLI